MTSTLLTPESKEALRKTIRGLRPRLLEQLLEAAKGEYRLDVSIEKAKLPEARHCRRERLESWLDEQIRGCAEKGKKPKNTEPLRQRFLQQAIKEAAHTWLVRLVMLRILEQHQLITPAVITGGWKSPAYEQEFIHFAGPLAQDDTRGYRDLLDTIFAELSLDLPGLFGPFGLVALFPMPAALLRELVEALNEPALDSAWGDDMTLGWIYQYWNDPEREQLDAKINSGGKIEPHEIASKTQMFTERYMVEWLLENSLGLTWLSICKKNHWTADAEAVLPVLDARRADWRKKREAGEVPLDALMPIKGPVEDAWKYYVPQPIPEDALSNAPASIREVKLLDPACGSGHFLVCAFGLFVAMYVEEAKHRGEEWTSEDVAESILSNNLHGIDIDPRAIQIAAAALWLKAKLAAPKARLGRMNLVAPCFRLGALPKNDPALLRLQAELKEEVGITEEYSQRLVDSLSGVDHLGTLLRVDAAIEETFKAIDQDIVSGKLWQGDLFRGFPMQQLDLKAIHQDQGNRDERYQALRATTLEKLEQFLDAHSTEADLGLRLEGEQLAAGLRFVRLVKEGTYDVVVGNPPYQGLSKTSQFEYVTKNYPKGKADLYAAFLERGLELAREGGLSALLTMRGWMFLGQFKELRENLLNGFDLWSLVDLDSGAFDEVSAAQVVLSVVCSVFRRGSPDRFAVAMRPTPTSDRTSAGMTNRKRAGLLAHVGRYEFDPKGFEVIEGEPIVYWWTKEFLERYAGAEKLGEVSPAKAGAVSGNHVRFLRLGWELALSACTCVPPGADLVVTPRGWVRYVKGARGRCWLDPCDEICNWRASGLEIKTNAEQLYGSYTRQIRNEHLYFEAGIGVAGIGSSFSSRTYRWRAVFDNMAASVFPRDVTGVLCSMNTSLARRTAQSLNPGIHFEIADVNRLPIFRVANSNDIFATIERAFTLHESHREPSVEFRSPGPSPWRYAQDWAQRSVDRAEGEPLPPYNPEYDDPPPEADVSFAIGVALGRFGADGEGILDVAPDTALPAGILFIGPSETMPDSMTHPGFAPIVAAWDRQQAKIANGKKLELRDWLRKEFFPYHKALYENRPIYFPLSSEKKSFVAWVSIHRFKDNTLQTLLADHLRPLQRRLEGEMADLGQGRASSDKKAAAAAEKQYGVTKRLYDELVDFIAGVAQCTERGAPPVDAKGPTRQVDATFHMDLDDGVMINSAALWPLLEPQWKEPKKWWKELCAAEGRKDYDWAHLAKRYFPERVDEKCKVDPSLAVAHGCFWKYHPAKAYAWELRLQDEIRPDFLIEEEGAAEARSRFLDAHPDEAKALYEKEMVRRERKAAKADADQGEDGVELEAAEIEDD